MALPRACPGAMQAAVQRIMPISVIPVVANVGECSPLTLIPAVTLASPKSRTLTVPSGLIRILGRLQVAVRDSRIMRCFEGVGNLTSDAQRFIEGQRAFRRFAFDVLHDEVVRADVMEGADVGMIERGDGLRFELETL